MVSGVLEIYFLLWTCFLPTFRSQRPLLFLLVSLLTVEVDGGLTVEAGHQVADAVERRLVEGAGFSVAVVHVEPWNAVDREPDEGESPAG